VYALFSSTTLTGIITAELRRIWKNTCQSICREIDQPGSALVRDLEQRGLLEDTIVMWGGEFGRTPMGEVRDFTGRNHHIDAFTMWFAGGGFKPGIAWGETDDFGFGPVGEPTHVRDIHATLLHQLGLNHERLSVRSQGLDIETDRRTSLPRDQRITDVSILSND
jgi:arylsulfatase A-like enzyme